MNEIIFEMREDELDGGFVATALGHAIATQGDTLEELREMARDAVPVILATEHPARCRRSSASTSSATRPWRHENPPRYRPSGTLARPHSEC